MFRIGSFDMGYVGKFHHIIADGWSLQIAGESIARYYSELVNEMPSSVEAVPSYVDAIEQEQIYLQSERFFEEQKLFGMKKICYTSRNNGNGQSFGNSRLQKDLDTRERPVCRDPDVYSRTPAFT
ncbi:condensation domain-containing protein [Paenibacillus rhizoplanae]